MSEYNEKVREDNLDADTCQDPRQFCPALQSGTITSYRTSRQGRRVTGLRLEQRPAALKEWTGEFRKKIWQLVSQGGSTIFNGFARSPDIPQDETRHTGNTGHRSQTGFQKGYPSRFHYRPTAVGLKM